MPKLEPWAQEEVDRLTAGEVLPPLVVPMYQHSVGHALQRAYGRGVEECQEELQAARALCGAANDAARITDYTAPEEVARRVKRLAQALGRWPETGLDVTTRPKFDPVKGDDPRLAEAVKRGDLPGKVPEHHEKDWMPVGSRVPVAPRMHGWIAPGPIPNGYVTRP